MKREKNGSHLAFLRTLPCVRCANPISSEAAHIRFGEPRAGKRPTGLGERPSDAWAVPMCGECHRLQHGGGEREFWRGSGIDPIFVALALYRASGDHEAGEQIIAACGIVYDKNDES